MISFIHSHYIDGQIPIYVYLLDIILTIALAELSYRYVETPFRKQGFKAFAINKRFKPQFIRTIITIVLALPLILILAGAFDKLGKDNINDKAQTFNTSENDKYLIRMLPIDDIKLTADGRTEEGKEDEVYSNIKPLLIGDSVMVDIGEQFKSRVPKANIDGKVGRNLYQALPLVDSNYKHYNQPSDQVVLELGTNGDFTEDQLDNLI